MKQEEENLIRKQIEDLASNAQGFMNTAAKIGENHPMYWSFYNSYKEYELRSENLKNQLDSLLAT